MNLPTTTEIIEDIEFLDDWESRYQYIIDLGKALPKLPEEERLAELKVKGCQSDVWLITQQDNNVLSFRVDSDAMIVRGLLAIVMAAYNEKQPKEITEFDIDSYFQAIDLENHLSPTRGNGLRAIVGKIKAIATEAA
ncbi:Fe-S cluster assembly protein SufE [Aliidiomarina iranensis]|uniref:Fe-S cluster assembly protein SufE n=1 Tax=Aliidiomarina iranensis TaxID=1434071 RepID=A0A432VW84_9GAMM|nr:SufE family protein [Aliidiomarina iranensis]RUO20852.1 Fe-S cluster assembly protein SufE [Aliidiomarina iranensis]